MRFGRRRGTRQKVQRSRGRQWNHAVRSLHTATGIERKGAAIERVNAEKCQAAGSATDIQDCVRRANFVEMHFFNCDAMYLRFALSQSDKDCPCLTSGYGREAAGVYNSQDFGQTALRRIVLVHQNPDVRGAYRSAYDLLAFHAPIRQGESAQWVTKSI
jgi:hypothetical protein